MSFCIFKLFVFFDVRGYGVYSFFCVVYLLKEKVKRKNWVWIEISFWGILNLREILGIEE